jgi:hypothetical protein
VTTCGLTMVGKVLWAAMSPLVRVAEAKHGPADAR